MSPRNARRSSQALSKWHRRLGIIAAVFVVVLSITGIALQHAPAFGLDRTPLGSATLARWFGADAPSITAFRIDDQWVSAAGDGLWLDDQRIASIDPTRPKGAVATGFGFVLVGGDGSATLFNASGQRLEHLYPSSGLPGPVERIGRDSKGRIVIESEHRIWGVGRDWLEFTPRDDVSVEWPVAEALPEELSDRIQEAELARAVTWERLILEIHSGRLAGPVGVFVMDAAALLLLVLAITGIILWRRRR